MKIELSDFLKKRKDLLHKLVNELNQVFEYASVLGTDSKGKSIDVKRTGISIGEAFTSERGFVVRVYNGAGYSEHSFNELSDENFSEVLDDIVKTAKNRVVELKDNGLSFVEYSVFDEEIITKEFVSEIEVDSKTVSNEEKIAMLQEVIDIGLAVSEEVVDVRTRYDEVHVSKVFISKNKDLTQSYIWSVARAMPLVSREGNVKYNLTSKSGLDGIKNLYVLKDDCEKVTRDTIKLLDAKKIVPGEYEIICNPGVAGLIAHEAFGHGVEMDMFVKNRAKAKDYLGEEVASSKVNMKDGAASAVEVASYYFDDEGNLGTDTDVIVDGILKSGFSDALSAMKLGTEPTGNGRRESFERKVYSRMTNTFFDKGEDTLEDMIASIKHGYYLEDYSSGMEDPKNWGIQCVILKTYEIIDGKLTDNVYSPVFLTGYVPDLLKSISMVSGDLELSGSGFCGKGHKELVKTSTGGSYIKAVGRLS